MIDSAAAPHLVELGSWDGKTFSSFSEPPSFLDRIADVIQQYYPFTIHIKNLLFASYSFFELSNKSEFLSKLRSLPGTIDIASPIGSCHPPCLTLQAARTAFGPMERSCWTHPRATLYSIVYLGSSFWGIPYRSVGSNHSRQRKKLGLS